jgi:agmatine deiminase
MSNYRFPAESAQHEGTWLIWPIEDHFVEDVDIEEIELIWIDMIRALVGGEKVHIVAFDEEYQASIEEMLDEEEIDTDRVDIIIAESDSYWTRDIGPIFVFDENGKLAIADFTFDS